MAVPSPAPAHLCDQHPLIWGPSTAAMDSSLVLKHLQYPPNGTPTTQFAGLLQAVQAFALTVDPLQTAFPTCTSVSEEGRPRERRWAEGTVTKNRGPRGGRVAPEVGLCLGQGRCRERGEHMTVKGEGMGEAAAVVVSEGGPLLGPGPGLLATRAGQHHGRAGALSWALSQVLRPRAQRAWV